MGINPVHFNGVYWPNHPPTVCQQPWMQFAWQAVDRVSREEVAMAIKEAEDGIERVLGYRLLPSWETDEWHQTVRPYRPELFNLSATDLRGFGSTVKTKWGYVVSGGVRAKALIEEAVAITFTDEDGDGYEETATAAVAVVAGQSPCEVRAYFPVAGVVHFSADDMWEIKPLQVTVAGLTATLTFRREQVVLPDLQLDLVPPADDSHLRGVDGSDDANFLAAVDVYRIYNDPQTQVTLLWEPFGDACGCGSGGCQACAYSAQTGCLVAREPRLGIVAYKAADWDADSLSFSPQGLLNSRLADLVRLYYYAGLRDKELSCPTTQMHSMWEKAVAYYAASLLDRPICECNNVRAWVEYWQKDVASAPPNERLEQIPEELLSNPLGTKRGALFAWRRALLDGEAIGRMVYA